MGQFNFFSLLKLYFKSLIISLALLAAFVLLNISVFASTRPVIVETAENITIRLSQVYFKGNDKSIPTYIPSISSPYKCESINLRNVIGEYGYTSARSTFLMHGNRDYYSQRGNPMEYINSVWKVNGNSQNIINTILEKEYLSSTDNSGKRNTWGYWWGVDSKPSCSDYTVAAPINGMLYGDFDKSTASGGYENNIIGTGIYSGFAIKLLHLANLDSNLNDGRVVNTGDVVNSVSRAFNHLHFTTLFGTGTGKIDVPFQYLVVPDNKFESYTAGSYKELSTLPDGEMLKYLELSKFDVSKSLYGFETNKLEQTYKYISTKTNKKVSFDIGVDRPYIVSFDQNGKFQKAEFTQYPNPPILTDPSIPNDPAPSPLPVPNTNIKKYKFTGTLYMYNAKEVSKVESGVEKKSYIKNGLNGRFCSPSMREVYGEKVDNIFVLYNEDKKTVQGICTWYDNWIKVLN